MDTSTTGLVFHGGLNLINRNNNFVKRDWFSTGYFSHYF